MANLAVNFAGISMKNPLFTASGTCGFGRELNDIFPIDKLGGIMVKGTTLQPRLGNDAPRIAETPSGVLNCVGLQNPGIENVLNEQLPWVLQHDLAVLANIAGNSPEDYAELAAKLDGVAGLAGLAGCYFASVPAALALVILGTGLGCAFGSVAHPMTAEHSIEWIYLQTTKGGPRKALAPNEAPVATFVLADEELVAVYAYCNLHGLWKTEI